MAMRPLISGNGLKHGTVDKPNGLPNDDSRDLGERDPSPGRGSSWDFNAFNILDKKIDGIDNRLSRIERLAWALIGAIALAGFLLGTWSPEIHVHMTPTNLPAPLTK